MAQFYSLQVYVLIIMIAWLAFNHFKDKNLTNFLSLYSRIEKKKKYIKDKRMPVEAHPKTVETI